eukprot:m.215597 g.215597  ORF g.215597 m.215597 type:complete len:344 (-) comp19105_c0_seq2:59-1090(-)
MFTIYCAGTVVVMPVHSCTLQCVLLIGWIGMGDISCSRLVSAADTKIHAGTQMVNLDINGRTRQMSLRVPWGACGYSCTGAPRCNASTPRKDLRPLVINWHGCNSHTPPADYQIEVSRLSEKVADVGWYTITPVGTETLVGGDYGWNTWGIDCGAPGVDDFAFANAIVKYATENLCVDPKLVFSAGFSTGAFLSYSLACKYPNLFAAIGINAGSISRLKYNECEETLGGVPVQGFHSYADPTVPFNGTTTWASQEEMMTLWMHRNKCTAADAPQVTFSSGTTKCTAYNCSGGLVEQCNVVGLDHCWIGGRSGGFPTCVARPGDVDVTEHMLTFWKTLVEKSRT